MTEAYLSKIATANGKEIPPKSVISLILWPFQPKPGPESLKTWCCFLANAFLEGEERKQVELRARDLVVRHPVGNWTRSLGWLQSKWDLFYSHDSQLVFILNHILHRYNVHSQKQPSCWTS
jgi:hypothetical protein